MKKHQFAMLAGILVSLFSLISCELLSGISNGNDTGVTNENYFKVTFDFGKYGQNTKGQSKVTNTAFCNFVNEDFCVIKDQYKLQVEFLYWHEAGVDTEFDSTKKITSDITLYAKYKAKDVGSVNIKPNEDSLFVSWKSIPNSKYHVDVTIGTETTSSILNKSSFLLENVSADTECTISVYTISNDETVENSEPLEGKGKTGITEDDVLVLFYMDGDNNLNDPIYLDLNEAEYGLSQISSSKKIRVVALWDGWDFKTNATYDDVSFFNQAPVDLDVHATAATRLLELAADSNKLYAKDGGIYFKGCEISPETKDLTATVDWIVDGEVDMSDYKTLENYLKWVNVNYKAKEVILQFSNHGGGPRAANISSFGRRSMCWDETSGGKTFLKTKDVAAALAAAGYGKGEGKKRLAMIIEDVCLGGSLEEVYELKDYAEYYVGSPNNIPGMGFDYTDFIKTLSDNVVSITGQKLVSNYRYNYKMTDASWKKYFNALGIDSEWVTANNYEQYVSVSNPNCSTLTCVVMDRVENIKDKVDVFAEAILNANDFDKKLKRDSEGEYWIAGKKYYDDGGNEISIPASAEFVTQKEAIKYLAAYFGDPIYYDGTFGCLKDLGYIANFVESWYADDSDAAELVSTARGVRYAIADALSAAWRDGYKKPTYDFGYYSSGDCYFEQSAGLGLTINCSCWVSHKGKDGKERLYEDFADWYKKELAFGKDCSNWTSLIQEWFSWE